MSDPRSRGKWLKMLFVNEIWRVVLSRDIAWSALDVVRSLGGILTWNDNLVVVLQMVEGAFSRFVAFSIVNGSFWDFFGLMVQSQVDRQHFFFFFF